MNDPMEAMITSALQEAGIDFATESDPRNTLRLDFYLPVEDLYIEVKRFHSDRIAEQMSRAENVIAVQGEGAVKFFANLFASKN